MAKKSALRTGFPSGARGSRKPMPVASARKPAPTAAGQSALLATLADLASLRQRFPPPAIEAMKSDARWLTEQLACGRLAALAGSHVAVLNQKVVGSGADALALQVRISRDHGIHPDRAVIVWLEPAE